MCVLTSPPGMYGLSERPKLIGGMFRFSVCFSVCFLQLFLSCFANGFQVRLDDFALCWHFSERFVPTGFDRTQTPAEESV